MHEFKFNEDGDSTRDDRAIQALGDDPACVTRSL